MKVKIERARVTVDARIRVIMDEDGNVRYELRTMNALPIMASRARTREECREDGTDNPWLEGGVAILDPRRDATNGSWVGRRMTTATMSLTTALRKVVDKLNEED